MEYVSIRTKMQTRFQSHTRKAGDFGIVGDSSVHLFSLISGLNTWTLQTVVKLSFIMIGVFICLCMGICEGMKKKEQDRKQVRSVSPAGRDWIFRLFIQYPQILALKKIFQEQNFTNFTLFNRNKALLIVFTYAYIYLSSVFYMVLFLN